MHRLSRLALAALFLATAIPGWSAEFGTLRQRAEDLLSRGSFAEALSTLGEISTNGLSPRDLRWLELRLGDARWRASGEGPAADPAALCPELLRLSAPEIPVPARDEFWAEANESLGDLYRQAGNGAPQMASHYRAALDWWGGRTNLDVARAGYLSVARRWAGTLEEWMPLPLPENLLDNAVSIARRPEDVAFFRLKRAIQVANRGGSRELGQVERDFEAARAAAAGTPALDAVLYYEAQWRERSGRLGVAAGGGGWERTPDPAGALALYRELIDTFPKGTSAYRDMALARVAELTGVSLDLAIPGTFLPGSLVQFTLAARNVTDVSLTLTPTDLVRDLRPEGSAPGSPAWLSGWTPPGPALRQWTERMTPELPHQETRKTVRLPEALPPGAYLLEARSGDRTARELILVTDAALVVQGGSGNAVAWLVDAVTGRPIPEAPVRISVASAASGPRGVVWSDQRGTTDAEGLAGFELPGGQAICVAGLPSRPAMAILHSPGAEAAGDAWKIFAFTDRPAYRPGAMVQWKVIARRQAAGVLNTPANSRLRYELRDPQGTAVTNGVLTLDSFGAAWGEFPLGASAPLGMYQVSFHDESRVNTWVGGASLFRLEEYRLPEFEVAVTAAEPSQGGGIHRPGRIRPGDRLETRIEARYYFGSPVAGGKAEVTVSRKPFSWFWPDPFRYSWLEEQGQPFHGGRMAPGQEVRRETLTLDAQGTVVFGMETHLDADDLEYTVSVSVTDSARRVVAASSDFKVTREGYSVRARPLKNLPKPGETVRVEFQAKDANGQPVATTGSVRITRERWWEIWLDSFGREVEGDELRRRRESSPVWPPRPEPGQRDWTLKFRGYRAEELGTRAVVLGTNGVGELSLSAERVGYYRFSWSSPDIWAFPGLSVAITNQIRAEAAVWVTTTRENDLGYRSDGLEILVDPDSIRTGTKAPVLIVGPNPDRWVLFTVQGGGRPVPQVLHLAGSTRLLELDVTESMEPNAVLQAVLVQDRQVLSARKDIVVPPVGNFLDVAVEPGAPVQRPGVEGTVKVRTRDHRGQPVSAQVAMSVVDASVFAIQDDLAGDPRSFFFPRRPVFGPWISSSFSGGGYLRFVREAGGDWRDDRVPSSERTGLSEIDTATVTAAAPALARRYGLMPRLEERVNDAPPGPVSLGAHALSLKSGVAGGGEPQVVVRSDFRETAFWHPAITTGTDGTASISFRYPDTATRWSIRALATTPGNQFGKATSPSTTRLPLGIRLQTPRFLVSGDEAIVSAALDNTTDAPLRVSATLEAQGLGLTGWIREGRPDSGVPEPVEVPPGGSARVDWLAVAKGPGTAMLNATARADGVADAVRREVPLVENGIEQVISHSGKTDAGEVTVRLDLAPRSPGSTRCVVRVTPSLAVSMLDALPYLADYPYGCTEQTLSRFLPAVVVRRTLASVGLDADAAMSRTFGGIPAGPSGAVSPALGGRKDLGKLDDMIAAGLKRLYDSQNGDAWGWWPGGGDDAWMTAYVVWGLRLARESDVGVDEERLARAERWLGEHLAGLEERPDDLAWALNALASRGGDPGPLELRALERLYGRRADLSPGGRALLAWVAHRFGRADWARVTVENMSNGVVVDEHPDASVLYAGKVRGGSVNPMAHWGSRGFLRRWSDGDVEATALSLRSLLAVEPGNRWVEPAVAWLLQNRKGASWNNTRDTAISLLCLVDYLKTTSALQAELEVDVQVNGRALAQHRWTPADVLRAPVEFPVPADWLGETNEVRMVRKGGSAPMYFGVEARYVTQGAPEPAGNGVFLKREYFRIQTVETLLNGWSEVRVPIRDGDPVGSGDSVECRIVVEAKSDLEYVAIEDHKPAGFEAMEVQSGWGSPAVRIRTDAGNTSGTPPPERSESQPLYLEWRDRRVAAFTSRLPAGIWEIRYRYRAETPGRFTALPVLGGALYVPDLRGNSAGNRVQIVSQGR